VTRPARAAHAPAGARPRHDPGSARTSAARAPLDWSAESRGWPNRDASRFVDAGGLRWHVQTMGQGPVLLLLHGTGASTHSWRGLAPALAPHYTVVAPDLPGHGFTQPAPGDVLTLPAAADAIAALLAALRVRPRFAVGHSAGAAIAIRMALDGSLHPEAVAGLNAALLPFDGVAGMLFPPMARMLSAGGVVAHLFAWLARDPAAVDRLVAATGSTLSKAARADYGLLLRSAGHVAGALRMMAGWDLQPLVRDLPALEPPAWLLAGTRDLTVPPSQARRAAALMPNARVVEMPGVGHLAHEERPARVARLLRRLLGPRAEGAR